eukprot:scaffold536_cov250-Pinguiococcus_pyrenoidosus.AAC.33
MAHRIPPIPRLAVLGCWSSWSVAAGPREFRLETMKNILIEGVNAFGRERLHGPMKSPRCCPSRRDADSGFGMGPGYGVGEHGSP